MKSFLSRRTMLRGAGGVSIALPLWFSERPSVAEAVVPQRRFLTIFFGNGLPLEFAARGFAGGPLSPLGRFAKKLTLVRGIKNESAADGVDHQHTRGGASFAVGRPNPSMSNVRGPSLDVAAMEAARPQTPLDLLCVSMFHWEQEFVRYVHSWRGPGRPNPGIRRPLALFHRLFGGALPADADGRQRRYARSVLDAVVGGYTYARSDAGGYSAEARRTLSDHLETVRNLERRAVVLDVDNNAGPACRRPPPPSDGDPVADCNTGDCPPAPDSDRMKASWDDTWATNADLFALALRCDLVRFGNVTLGAAGDRYNLPGLPAHVHDLAHGWRAGQENGFDKSVFWIMEKLALFLERLDDPTYVDGEGRTMLDRTPILIGTELGNPATHSYDDMSFILAGGGGLFRGGIHDFGNKSSDVDLYRTVAKLVGVTTSFGDNKYFRGDLGSLRGV